MITLRQFILGKWTWAALVLGLLPVIIAAGGAYFVGFERGWHQGFLKASGLLENVVPAPPPRGAPQ